MQLGRFLPGTLGLCLLSGMIGSAVAAGGGGNDGQPQARLALYRLQSNFHEAGVTGDYELMLGSWAEDAVFTNPAGTFHGAEEIATWFTETPLWGKQAALSPSYKTSFDIQGNTAEFVFECVLVSVPDGDPLNVSLAAGSGNGTGAMEIVGHTKATGTAVKRGDVWVFQTFTGGPVTFDN